MDERGNIRKVPPHKHAQYEGSQRHECAEQHQHMIRTGLLLVRLVRTVEIGVAHKYRFCARHADSLSRQRPLAGLYYSREVKDKATPNHSDAEVHCQHRANTLHRQHMARK